MDQERKRRAKREEELSQMAKAIIQPLLEQFNDTLIISQVKITIIIIGQVIITTPSSSVR